MTGLLSNTTKATSVTNMSGLLEEMDPKLSELAVLDVTDGQQLPEPVVAQRRGALLDLLSYPRILPNHLCVVSNHR